MYYGSVLQLCSVSPKLCPPLVSCQRYAPGECRYRSKPSPAAPFSAVQHCAAPASKLIILSKDSGGKVTSVMLEDPQVFQEHLAQSRRFVDSNRLQRPSREENVSGGSWN